MVGVVWTLKTTNPTFAPRLWAKYVDTGRNTQPQLCLTAEWPWNWVTIKTGWFPTDRSVTCFPTQIPHRLKTKFVFLNWYPKLKRQNLVQRSKPVDWRVIETNSEGPPSRYLSFNKRNHLRFGFAKMIFEHCHFTPYRLQCRNLANAHKNSPNGNVAIVVGPVCIIAMWVLGEVVKLAKNSRGIVLLHNVNISTS